MIQANELRIGNIVSDKGNQPGERYYVVTEITRWLVRCRHASDGTTLSRKYEQVTPIPLTPTILSACGFAPLSDPEFTHHHPELNILFDGEFFWLKQGKVTHYLSKCEYLHKLQNGVFWVTGKELIVNIEEVKV